MSNLYLFILLIECKSQKTSANKRRILYNYPSVLCWSTFISNGHNSVADGTCRAAHLCDSAPVVTRSIRPTHARRRLYATVLPLVLLNGKITYVAQLHVIASFHLILTWNACCVVCLVVFFFLIFTLEFIHIVLL